MARRRLTLRERITGFVELISAPHGDTGRYLPPTIPVSSLDLERWRSSEELTEFSKSLFANPSFLSLLSMLATIRPIEPRNNEPFDGFKAARLLGQRQGHEQIIEALKLSAIPSRESVEEPEADYGVSEESVTNR